MACAGAQGDTEQQMADVLHFGLPQGQLLPAFNALRSPLLCLDPVCATLGRT